MTLESSKNLGGIGAILLIVGSLAGAASLFAGALSLVGLILVLIGLKGMADHFKEPGILSARAWLQLPSSLWGCLQ